MTTGFPAAAPQRPTRRQSLDQQRAAQAATDVRAITQLGDKDKRSYRSLIEGLPAMIVANGLGQTCAYLLSRAENNPHKPESKLYEHLQVWLTTRVGGLHGRLLDALMQADVGTYRRAQIEALAYVQWLKRFAQAELPKGDGRT